MPRPTYFFAIETTRRRFASVSLRFASSPSKMTRVVGRAVLERFFLAGFDRHRETAFVIHREERDAPDLLEIHADRVVEGETSRHRDLFGLLAIGRLFVLRLLFDDLDAERGDLFEQIVHALGRDVLDVVEDGVDLFVRERAALLADGEKLLDLFVER